MAKLIVTGANRDEVLRRARRALKEFRIEGVATVLPFHRAAINTEDFIGSDGFKVHTRWIETDFAAMPDAMERPEPAVDPSMTRTWMEIDGKRISVGLPNILLSALGTAGRIDTASAETNGQKNDDGVVAPVSGTLQSFKVEDGATVAEGDLLAVMEAMKMETQITAPQAGKVRLLAKEGDYLQAGATLLQVLN